MDRKEFDELFKDQNVKLELCPPIGGETYKTFIGLKNFLQQEVEFWTPFNQGHTNTIRLQFTNLLTNLNALDSKIENESINWNTALRDINTYMRSFNSKPMYNITSNNSAAVIIQRLYNQSSNIADGFIKFMSRQAINSSQHYEFLGALEAHSFLNSSMSSTKVKSYEEIMNRTSEMYVNEIDSIQYKYHQIQEKYIENTANNASMINELKISIEDWRDNSKVEAENFIRDKNGRMNKLENLYTEKLKLQSPARYW